MIHIRIKGLPELIRGVNAFSKTGVPYAVRDTLNDSAFALRKEWQGEIKRSFTLRNQYTERSIRVDKAQGRDVRSMEARTGSIAAYMAEQEEGATVRGKGKHKAIPAPAAAGQSPGAAKRTRTVRAGLRLSAINVANPAMAGYGKRRQNAIALAIARRRGDRFALLNRAKGKGRGLFEVRGFSKRKVRMRMLYDLSKGSVRVKPEPTLQRSITSSHRAFEQAQAKAFVRQLRRCKVFGYR